MYYLCSETKGADQLHGYCAADLRLCFRLCKKQVFSKHGSYYLCINREDGDLSGLAGWSESLLVAYGINMVSHGDDDAILERIDLN